MQLHADVNDLAAAMRQLEGHLRDCRQTGWANSVGRAAELVERGEAQGLYLFERMFGGMGSLNDLGLGARFDELRERAFELAQTVRRSHLRV